MSRRRRPKTSEGWKHQLKAQLNNKLGWSDRGNMFTRGWPNQFPSKKYPQIHIKIETLKGWNGKLIHVGFTKRPDEEITWLGYTVPSKFPDPKHITQLMLIAP